MSAPGADAVGTSDLLDRDGNPLPPLPEDATPEQKDAHWYQHVYQGDRMPQLTVRAVLMGGVLGMLMAASNLYTTLAIGWAFGVAITACVMSFVIWNGIRGITFGAASKMSVLENNCMQSTASAAGYSTGSTIATMFGAMLLLTDIPEKTAEQIKSWDIQPVWVVAVFTMCTGLMGVFLAIPMKRQMINYEGLRFPSGIAAAETLRSLHSASKDAIVRAYVLLLGIFAGLVVGILNTGEGTLPFLDRFNERVKNLVGIPMRIPEAMPETGFFMMQHKQVASLQFEPSLLLIAAGVITRLRVCISMFAGALLLFYVVGPALVRADLAAAPASGWREVSPGEYVFDARTREEAYRTNIPLNVDPNINKAEVARHPEKYVDDPNRPAKFSGAAFRFTVWSLWGGTAVMVFASLASLALQWKTVVRAFSGVGRSGGGGGPSAMAGIEVPTAWMVAGMIPITLAMVAVQIVAFNIAWWSGLIAVGLSFFLVVVACRATGETDTTPIGAMGKVMQLLFAVLHPGDVKANLASAGIAANSASSSADLLTDLKSGYLLGANPRKQFIAQFIGVFFGTIAIVPIWFLMVPNKAALEKFAAPATRQWEAVARVLTKGIDQLPHSAQIAVLIGASVGILLPIIERLVPARQRHWVPSAMGLGLSWVIPFSSALGFFIGAVIGKLWEVADRKSSDKYAVSLASGMIAGEGLIKAIIAMAATAIGLLAAK